ncbi:MAG TPA: hypothetical protein VF220_07700 [Nitrososphaeraceae archaeon]
MSALQRIEKILDIWNILITVNGGIVTNVGSLQTKSVPSRHLTDLYDEQQFLSLFTSNFFRI